MTSRAATEYRYEKLTWPEINDAVALNKVCILPCGAVEQHGPHLPLDVDLVCPGGIAVGAGRQLPGNVGGSNYLLQLSLRIVTAHANVMGTIRNS